MISLSPPPLLFGPQLIMFGLNNQLVVAYKEENMMALKHLFVRDYSGVDEDDYSTAVYTQQDFYQSLSFVLDQVRAHSAILCSSWPCGYFSVLTPFGSDQLLWKLCFLHKVSVVCGCSPSVTAWQRLAWQQQSIGVRMCVRVDE